MAGVATGLTAPGPWTWYGGASWLLGRECNERQVPDLLMGTWSGLTWGSLCNSAWTWEKRKRKMRLKRLTRFKWQQCWPQSTVFMYQTTTVDDTTREGHDKLSVTQGNVCEDPRLCDRILSPKQLQKFQTGLNLVIKWEREIKLRWLVVETKLAQWFTGGTCRPNSTIRLDW